MKKKVLTLLILFLCSIAVMGQKIDSLAAQYQRVGIHIEVPAGFAVQEPLGEWADWRLERDSMELMYKAMDVRYEQIAPDPSKRPTFYWAMSMATVKNLSIEELPKIGPLPKEGLTKDFNADLGFICLFTPRSTVSAYKHGFILGIHKSGHPDVAVVLLGNDLEKLKKSVTLWIIGKVKYN